MDFKRRLAVAACAPNVSVSKLALEHEVNANMVFKWRRQYRAGLLGAEAGTTFLPVAVKMVPGETAPATAEASRPAVSGGTIEIVIGDAVVRVQGKVDARLLRTVVQSLRP
jgi:transposase